MEAAAAFMPPSLMVNGSVINLETQCLLEVNVSAFRVEGARFGYPANTECKKNCQHKQLQSKKDFIPECSAVLSEHQRDRKRQRK